MNRKTLLAIFAIFIAWSALDFVIHGILLKSTYETTAHLWRPMNEMNMPLTYLVSLVSTICFVLIYQNLISAKSVGAGIKFGALFGLAWGFSMGFGTYSYMPIPSSLAVGWFLGSWIEFIVAGAIVGKVVKQ